MLDRAQYIFLHPSIPKPMNQEEKEKKERQRKSLKEKKLGNAAYKKKDFKTAFKHYPTAMEIDDKDISFIPNCAVVYLEMGKVLKNRMGIWYHVYDSEAGDK